MRMRHEPHAVRWAPLALLGVISIAPVVAGLIGAVTYGLDRSAWQALLETPGLGRAVFLSIWTGTVATAIAVAIAHASLAVAATGRWSGKLRGFALPLLASPHLALGIGLVLLLSPSGLVVRALSPWATGFAHPPDWATVQDAHGVALICGLVIKEVPFLILVLFAARAQVDAERLMLQARTLGYGRLKSWLIAVAPLLQRQARLGTAAVLIFAVTNVEMTLPLGPTAPPPLAVLLLNWFSDADLSRRAQAFAGAWLLLGVTLACLLIAYAAACAVRSLWRRAATSGSRATGEASAIRTIGAGLTVTLTLGVLAVVALLLRSVGGAWRFPALLPDHLSLGAWRRVAPDLGASLTSSFSLALATAVTSVLLVLVAAEAVHTNPTMRRRIGAILFIPLLLPQMAFLFGWQVVLVRIGLDGTAFAVAWSHMVFALPYVWAVLAEARAALNPGYQVAARVLGADSARTWLTITTPLLLRSMLLAFALAFSVSVAVYLPTLFAGAGRIATLATEAGASVSAGDITSAAASGAAQALLPLALFGGALWSSSALFRHRRGVPR